MPTPLVPLLLFAKAPVAGAVKTRLAATVGEMRAARMAAALLEDSVERFGALPGVPLVLVGDRPNLPAFVAAAGGLLSELPPLRYRSQGEGSLGARLRRCFAALEVGLGREEGGLPVAGGLAIGADAPHLDPGSILIAADAVRKGGSALGEATDGGYSLIGVPCGVFDLGALFPDTGWGEPGVFAHARSVLVQGASAPARHESQVLSVPDVGRDGPDFGRGALCELPPLTDIDEWPDLLALADALAIETPRGASGLRGDGRAAVDPPALRPLSSRPASSGFSVRRGSGSFSDREPSVSPRELPRTAALLRAWFSDLSE